jgi:hypothetical protein
MNKGWKYIITPAIVFGLVALVIMLDYSTQTEITPNDEFFVVSIGSSPYIEADYWLLEVNGLVDNPLFLTYENLTSFPITSEVVTLKCVDGPTGTANWTGVKLNAILDMAGIKANATEVIFYGADGYSSSLTIGDATSEDVILAYEMNGETLPRDHGFPARLVVPGKYGYKWVKWIVEIEVVDYDYQGYWESRGWDDDADITALSDWWAHSLILTVAAYFGTLAVLSGFRFSKHVEFGKKLPSMFTMKFHMRASFLYIATLVIVTMLWIANAINRRGGFPNSGHGILALAVGVLALTAGITGYLSKRYRKDVTISTIHLTSTFLGYLLLLGTIFTGFVISGIIRIF